MGKKRRGIVLAFVVCIFTVISLLYLSASAYFTYCVRTAARQDGTTKAYYIMLSGLELGMAALFQDYAADDGGTARLIDWYSPRYADFGFGSRFTGELKSGAAGEGQIVLSAGNEGIDGVIDIQIAPDPYSGDFVRLQSRGLFGGYESNGYILIDTQNPANYEVHVGE
jgi:hypothetical protein